MSIAEAKVFMQEHGDQVRAEVERALATAQVDDAHTQSAERVTAQFKAQLDAVNRFTGPVNDAYASMLGAFYSVQAARLGVTPEEMLQRYPLTIAAGVDIPSLVVDLYTGVPLPERLAFRELATVRFLEDVIVDVDEVLTSAHAAHQDGF